MRPSTTSTTKPLHIPTISRVPEKRLDWSVVASLPGSLPEGYSDGGGGGLVRICGIQVRVVRTALSVLMCTVITTY